MVNLFEEVVEVADPTQSASAGTEAALRLNPATVVPTAASDAADFVTGNDNSPNPAVGAAVGVTDFLTNPFGGGGSGEGGGNGGSAAVGLGNLLTPRNIAIALAIYFVVTRTGAGERIGDVVTGAS